MTIGEEVLIHGYIDEIRKDIAIIRNEGGYFGTVPEEIRSSSEIPNTCGDAISRVIVQEEITKSIELKENPHQLWYRIQALPSVTPQQRTGRWIDDEFGSKCSCCGIYTHLDKFDRPMKFKCCSMCGAKMEVEE